MPASNVDHLRQLIADKFPRVRSTLKPVSHARNILPTGLPQLDAALGGGLAKGTLTEMVSSGPGCGAASIIRALLESGAAQNAVMAFVDASNSLNVEHIAPCALSRLLWVRCKKFDEAIKAADLLVRDRNISMLLIDLAMAKGSCAIHNSAWYRLQRLAQFTSTVTVIFSPAPMVSPAVGRVILNSRFTLDDLECQSEELLKQIHCEPLHLLRPRVEFANS